ncbi:MAG: voltage-gated chloride channel family protein [Cytophagaceae bacterium]
MVFNSSFFNSSKYQDFFPVFFFVLKWILICLVVGTMAGSASALFLFSLHWAENIREKNFWIITLLPVAGLVIGLMYHYLGKKVEGGNNIIIEQIQNPKERIQLRMTPLVLIGTVVTHLFGGSAGREGTAVQMGGSLADQLCRFFKIRPRDRKILLICGISAGFSSVFGTPIAGAIFGLEVCIIGRLRYEALVPAFFSAIIADYITILWGANHTHYTVPELFLINPGNILYAIGAGIAFGVCARVFILTLHYFSQLFKKIQFPPLRPVAGGVVVASAVFLLGTTKYIGLGIPVIEQSFTEQLSAYDFILKLILTAITLGAAFKGGEVTPLFFIGATLGNALSYIIPMPIALLAAMGFVAVFAGAANTPIACMLMGFELFGIQAGVYISIACVVSYIFSGHSGIYHSQIIGSSKHLFFGKEKRMRLKNIEEYRRGKMLRNKVDNQSIKNL